MSGLVVIAVCFRHRHLQFDCPGCQAETEARIAGRLKEAR